MLNSNSNQHNYMPKPREVDVHFVTVNGQNSGLQPKAELETSNLKVL